MDVEDLLDLFHQCILMMIFSIDVSSWMLDILDFFYNDFNQVSYTTSEIPFWMLDILDFFITTNLTSCITL